MSRTSKSVRRLCVVPLKHLQGWKCYWCMLSPLGVSLKGHLGPFIPDMKVEGNIIEALQHDRGFSFQWKAWKGRVVFLHPLSEKPHNWLKWLLFSSWLVLEVIGIYEVFMVLLCKCKLHTEQDMYFLDWREAFPRLFFSLEEKCLVLFRLFYIFINSAELCIVALM